MYLKSFPFITKFWQCGEKNLIQALFSCIKREKKPSRELLAHLWDNWVWCLWPCLLVLEEVRPVLELRAVGGAQPQSADPPQCLSRCGEQRRERTERSGAPGPGLVFYFDEEKTERERERSSSGAAWSSEGCRPSGTCSLKIRLWFVYLPLLRDFPNMETTRCCCCWLLLTAHFILICQQGRTCFSALCPQMTQKRCALLTRWDSVESGWFFHFAAHIWRCLRRSFRWTGGWNLSTTNQKRLR